MNADKVQAMLRMDRIGWDALVSLLDAHPGESLHDPASPVWTSRDVYAHLARWLNRSNAHIEAYCAGRELPQFSKSPEEMNDIWQKEDSVLTLAEARRKAGVALASRLVAIESIPLDKWDEEMHRLVNIDGATHFAAHLNYIVEG